MPALLSLGARTAARPVAIAGIAAVYFFAARLGLSLGVVEQVSAIWPPTGIALAAVLVLGGSVWPGIWLGAFLANLTANEPVGTALGIAAGNTLEAVCGAWLLRRVGFSHSLERVRDVLALALFAVPLAAALSASIGVTSLCLGAVQPWSRFESLWSVWWLGDTMGALLVGPVLLTWVHRSPARERAIGIPESVCFSAGLLLASVLVFVAPYAAPHQVYSLPYVIFPFMIWSALRFGQPGTSLAILAASSIATWATARGLGPFGNEGDGDHWLHLQGFMGLMATTGLMLGGAVSERDKSERYRAAESAITRILAEGVALPSAIRRILEAVCECLRFDLGAVWTVDADLDSLRCVDLWHRPGISVPDFAALTRRHTFAAGIGLPGRVWSSGRPVWIEDVVKDSNFPRAGAAARNGLHGAFGFPMILEGKVLGVLEFFSREVRQPDAKLLQLLTSAGSQIGQFMERKRAEEAVRASEARKAGVLASVLDAIVTMDHEGRVLEFNRSAEQTFGYSADAAIGKELASLIIPEPLRERHRRGLARTLATGRSGLLDRRLEMTAVRADGSELPVELAITRVSGSNPPLFTGSLRDITDRKRAEAERAELLALEQQARARSEALTEHLRDEERAKDLFLATLGHELRNPLAPLSNAIQILRMGAPGDAAAHRLYEMLDRQVRHITRLVDDLLDVSRIKRGKIELRLERVDLVDVVSGAIEMNRAFIEERGHRLTVSLPATEVPVDADPTRMQQIVSNLLNNAARYTPDPGEITVALEREGKDALVRVRDSGIGIRPDLLERVFDPFTRGDSDHQGLGLGLALVKSLTELHGGSASAASPGPGSGSEFAVRLPLAAAVELDGQVAGEPEPEQGDRVRKRILIVDDNKDSAETLAIILRRRGHDVAIAHDGRDALEKFREFGPDAVLLDIALPHGMSGHDVALRIRQMPGTSDVLLIATTGFGQAEDRQRSRDAGIQVHLVKPVDPSHLQDLLGSAR